MTIQRKTDSVAATKRLATKVAHLLRGGETIELSSDLGGGKTTFVQGLAVALGYKGEVTSPTFTISRLYVLPDGRELHHYDLYRLGQSGVVGDELAEDLGAPEVITVIEWAKTVERDLPKDRLQIAIEVTAGDAREFTISSGGPRSDEIVKELTQ